MSQTSREFDQELTVKSSRWNPAQKFPLDSRRKAIIEGD
jgi:hypothetical protein